MIRRSTVALLVGLVAGLFCYSQMLTDAGPSLASDFGYHRVAALAILHGQDPYQAVASQHFDSGYFYPLPTALIVIPFVGFSPALSAAVFVFVSTTLLAFALPYRMWPIFGSIPFVWSAAVGQPGVLSLAGTLLPGLGWLALIKPNVGLALVAYRPRKSIIIGGVLLLIASLIIQPSWPVHWIASIHSRSTGNYRIPLLTFAGPVLLLAVLRWRRPEARLLLVMACVPQSMFFYDQLPLGLIAKTRNEGMLLAITSIIAYYATSSLAAPHIPAHPTTAALAAVYTNAIVIGIYLPALIMVLRRPASEPSEPDSNTSTPPPCGRTEYR